MHKVAGQYDMEETIKYTAPEIGAHKARNNCSKGREPVLPCLCSFDRKAKKEEAFLSASWTLQGRHAILHTG